MRYDSDFEHELYNAAPLLGSALQDATIKYKGSYRHWTGKFMYLGVQTRPDILFATQRLSEYNHSPTTVTFEAITRVLRYLAGDMIRPLTFPKSTFESSNKIIALNSPDPTHQIEVQNVPSLFTDAELAKDLGTRRTYFCSIITVFNVVVDMKIQRSSTVMQHTTDSEMFGSAKGLNRLRPVRQLFAFCGYPLPLPTTMYGDNSAVEAVITSKRMTPRCRHIDIPIAILQEEYDKSFKMQLIRTMVMLADMGTKANSPQYHKLFKYWASGTQFLPPIGHNHYDLLHLQYYEKNYGDILKMLASN
jgi:hypothetical protein